MHSSHASTSEVKRPTAIDLFSGCGGLSLGLKDAGFRILAAVEIDDLAAETFRANHPDVSLFHGDIRNLSGRKLQTTFNLKRGDLDLLAGCPPCQGFSRLRIRNGSCRNVDPRNQLIDDVLRLVESLYPKVVMIENVPALAQYSRYLEFKRRLQKLSYKVDDSIIDVSEHGVPQRRKRLVVLASRLGTITHPKSRMAARTVRDAIGKLPNPSKSRDLLHSLGEIRSARIRNLIKQIPKNGGSRKDLPDDLVLPCHRLSDGYFDVYGRMNWDEVSPTITGGCINPSKGRFLHPTQHRAITLREAALLQTFPASYSFSLRKGKYAAAEMIGNALPPKFSKIQGAAIKRHLRTHASAPKGNR